MVSDFNFKRYPVNLRFPREVRDDLENMQRIAAPGGMITAPLLSLFVVPAMYLLLKIHGLKCPRHLLFLVSMRKLGNVYFNILLSIKNICVFLKFNFFVRNTILKLQC
jgi:hypothetical protein